MATYDLGRILCSYGGGEKCISCHKPIKKGDVCIHQKWRDDGMIENEFTCLSCLGMGELMHEIRLTNGRGYKDGYADAKSGKVNEVVEYEKKERIKANKKAEEEIKRMKEERIAQDNRFLKEIEERGGLTEEERELVYPYDHTKGNDLRTYKTLKTLAHNGKIKWGKGLKEDRPVVYGY